MAKTKNAGLVRSEEEAKTLSAVIVNWSRITVAILHLFASKLQSQRRMTTFSLQAKLPERDTKAK
jgi:hypothetical protein